MKRICILRMVTTVLLALLALPAAAQAQTTIVGSLANFDAVNDTEGEKHGFEIELEHIQKAEITRVFGQNGAQCWIRYCIGSITPYGNPLDFGNTDPLKSWGVYVRWTSNYNAATGVLTVPAPTDLAGRGTSGTPSRVGALTPQPPVNGEQCWTMGQALAYSGSGCEHFGISTAPGKNPTKVTYRWMMLNPLTQVIEATVPIVVTPNTPPVYRPAPPVAIAHPIVQVIPPAIVGGVPQVEVAIPAPAPIPDPIPAPAQLARRYGKAQWVKEYKTEINHDADLDELVGGHADQVIEAALAVPAETEWKLLQLDTQNPTKGNSELRVHGSPNAGSRAVVRRYEFYKYTGKVVPAGGTSGGGKGGGSVLSTDDAVETDANRVCTRATPGDPTSACVAPGPNEVGDYIGAQMVAQNLADNRLTPTIAWPAPAPIVYGTALGAAQQNAKASATGVASVAGTFTYTPEAGAFLPAGVRTLQVVFTPADATKFSSQTMTTQITVNRAPMTVTADHQTKIYGTPDPTLTFKVIGVQAAAGDTEATVLSGALDRAAGSNVAKYAINLGTLATTSNYAATFTGNTLDITPAPLSIAANDAAKTYGQTTTFAGTEFTATGLAGADAVASVSLTSSGAAAAASAGTFPIVASAAIGTGLGNYTIGYVDGTLTINKADATVSTSGGTFAYDGLSHASTGASNVAGSFTYAYTPGGVSAPVSASATPYSVTATFVATDALNYNSAVATNAITINKALATVTAGSGTKVYATADPALSATATGFVAADGITVSAARAAGEIVGAYATTATAVGDLSNYNVTYVAGSFSITKASATVTAGSGAKVYGTADPALGATATGFVAADGITVSATRAAGEIVGAYATTATAVGDLSNYNVTYVPGSFSITKASAIVTLSNLTQAFAGTQLTPTATTTPANLAITLTGAPDINAGTYAVTATVTDPNYQGSASGTFTITAPPPPVGINIAPVPDQRNKEGDEVDLHVVVVGAVRPAVSASATGPHDDDARFGLFTAAGLPGGLKIDKEDGEISGHISGNTAGTYTVTVTFTESGVTVSQRFVWTVAPAAPRKGGKG